VLPTISSGFDLSRTKKLDSFVKLTDHCLVMWDLEAYLSAFFAAAFEAFDVFLRPKSVGSLVIVRRMGP
jgi:hypothetical protein